MGFVDSGASWIDAGHDVAGKNHMLACQLLPEQAWVRANLTLAQLQLSYSFFPTPKEANKELSAEPFSWLQYCAESVTTCFQVVTPESLEEWQRWWRLEKIRSARLLNAIDLLRRESRLLSRAIQLLKNLAHPLFPYQTIRREQAWWRLHGAHPPREDAGVSRPAFAEPGRVLRAGLLTF
jgi:hypothetical protein